MSAEAIVMQFLAALASALPKLWELWSRLGDRDAFLAALDSALVTARSTTDADLARKHGAP